VNEYDKVMTENLAERFVDDRNVNLAPQVLYGCTGLDWEP